MAVGPGGTETTLNTYSCVEFIRKYPKATDSDMVHLEKALTTKVYDLSSIPRTLKVGGKNRLLKVVFQPPNVCHSAHMCTQTYNK